MRLPRIKNAGVYTVAQRSNQVIHGIWLSFYVRGLIRNVSYYPDGTLLHASGPAPKKPSLSLSYPGFRTEFEYGPDRENWVIMLDFDDIFFREAEHQFYFRYDETMLPVPQSIPVPLTEVNAMREMFSSITNYYCSQLPENLLTAEIMTLSILSRFLESRTPADDVIEQFRKALDQDIHWARSLEEISAELQTGRDWLREKFFARYHISPGEYRIGRRLQRIRHLLSCTSLNLKEIAYEVGMKNQSHLSSFIRTHCGLTPSELCRCYRGDTPTESDEFPLSPSVRRKGLSAGDCRE